MKILKYVKIGSILSVSLFISVVLTKSVFVTNSPQIAANPIQNLTNNINFYKENPSALVKVDKTPAKQALPVASEQNQNTVSQIQDIINTQSQNAVPKIYKGVYAQETPELSYVIIKEDEVEWKEYTYYIKGKMVKLLVPAGEDPPPQERLEQLRD